MPIGSTGILAGCSWAGIGCSSFGRGSTQRRAIVLRWRRQWVANRAANASERGRERERDLRDLGGVGAATQRDLSWLGITTESQLRTCDHLDLYN